MVTSSKSPHGRIDRELCRGVLTAGAGTDGEDDRPVPVWLSDGPTAVTHACPIAQGHVCVSDPHGRGVVAGDRCSGDHLPGRLTRRKHVWRAAVRRTGIPDEIDLHLHDLRHTGSTWTAQSGATLKEVMARIGHSSTRAAMVYQHATRERDRAIAAALDQLIDEARNATESNCERS